MVSCSEMNKFSVGLMFMKHDVYKQLSNVTSTVDQICTRVGLTRVSLRVGLRPVGKFTNIGRSGWVRSMQF